MKKKSMIFLAALCLLWPISGAAEGLPDFLPEAGAGLKQDVTASVQQIAAPISEELTLALDMDEPRVEEGQTVVLRVTAGNPLPEETTVTLALSLSERLACAQETEWEVTLPSAQLNEEGVLTPSETVFERELTLMPGGSSETISITCEMSMGTRFYRAQQTLALCVPDISASAELIGSEERLHPGDTFAYRIEVTNAGLAAKDVPVALVLPSGVSLTQVSGDLSQAGQRLTGTVHAEAAQEDETGAAASSAVIELTLQVDEDVLDGDDDALRLLVGVLSVDGVRVPLPRVQVCGPKISAQLIPDADELAMGEETVLRVMVVNSGLAEADVELSCLLPEGLTLLDTQGEQKADKTSASTADEAEATTAEPDEDEPVAALADQSDTLPPAAGAAELVETAETDAITVREDSTIVLSAHMDAAEESDAGVTASTKVFELHVRADEAQKNLKEKLVGTTLVYQINGGETELSESVALRVYRPTFLGIAKEDWGGIFWATLLLLVTVSCLYAAVKVDSRDEEYTYD